MSIVVTARMYAQAFKDRGLHAKNLSRAVEDSATVTANLVPWNSGGSYQASVLGVATLAYLPFAFFCWLSPIITLLFGVFNINITKIDPKDQRRFGDEAFEDNDIVESEVEQDQQIKS